MCLVMYNAQVYCGLVMYTAILKNGPSINDCIFGQCVGHLVYDMMLPQSELRQCVTNILVNMCYILLHFFFTVSFSKQQSPILRESDILIFSFLAEVLLVSC